MGVYHDFLSKSVSHRPKKFGGATLMCFRKNRVSKKLTDNKGTSLLSVDIFSFHSAEKVHAETHRCFRKFLVPQVFFDKRRVVCHIFLPKFCLTVLKKLVEQPFCASEKFCYRKMFWIWEEGVVSRYLSKSLSHTTGKFRRGTLLCFRKRRVSEIFMDKRRGGVSQFFVKVFVSQYREMS